MKEPWEDGDLSVKGSSKELCGGVHQVVLQAQRHVNAGTYARLHQGVCGLSLHGSGIAQRHDIGKVHVAERRGDACALQRADTEEPICAVPHQPECQGARVFDGGRVESGKRRIAAAHIHT